LHSQVQEALVRGLTTWSNVSTNSTSGRKIHKEFQELPSSTDCSTHSHSLPLPSKSFAERSKLSWTSSISRLMYSRSSIGKLTFHQSKRVHTYSVYKLKVPDGIQPSVNLKKASLRSHSV
jgi:hypothetical protein